MARPLDRKTLAAVRLLVLDVDGVLTDGVIALDDRGVETKHFSVRDGSAIALWRKSGRKVAILSGRKAECVKLRAAELGIEPAIQGASAKLEPFHQILISLNIPVEQTCYVGDDWADLPVLEVAGVSACPSDAAEEVRDFVQLVAQSSGGRGAVREIIQIILKECGEYDDLIRLFRPVG